MSRVLAAVCVAWSMAAPSWASAAGFRHVRSSSPEVRALVEEGYRQSATMRGMVDDLEAASIIVYIEPAVGLSGGRHGVLLHKVSGSPALPILRVLVNTNLGRAQTISVIAHELQHTLEAVGAGVASAADMTRTFAALDADHAHDATGFETEAAREVQARVLSELLGRDGHK